MLTFHQFLIREEFFKGVKAKYDYVEVFKNPSRSELKDLSHGSSTQQIGAIVSGRNLYVWDRFNGEHADVVSIIPRASKEWMPLYIYYNATKNSVGLDVSAFSMYSTERHDYNTKDMVATCQKHPAFKMFDKVGLMKY